jgi:hypothetical protein
MNSLLLDILLVNVVASTSSRTSTHSSPCATVVIIIRVNASTSLTVISGGEASRMGGTPRLGPPLVPTKSLLPVNRRCIGSLLRLAVIINIVIGLDV